MGVIFVFFGRNATGKTELIQHLQKETGLSHAHTRRLLAQTNPAKPEKELVQEYAKQSRNAYLEAIKKPLLRLRKSDGLIIEGPFSIEEVKKIGSFFPHDQVMLIDVTAKESVRVTRLKRRHNLTSKEAYAHMRASDRLRIQRGLAALEGSATVKVSNDTTLEEFFSHFKTRTLKHQRQRLLQTLTRIIHKKRSPQKRHSPK
jgi:dephospho-CoA kinase